MATRRNERQGLPSSPHIRMTSLRARCCSFWANPNSPSPPSNAMASDCRMHITLFSGNRTHGHARLGITRPFKLSQNGSVWLITGNKIAGRTSVSPPRNAVRTLSPANELLRRAKTAQRLQGCGRVCGNSVALDSGSVDFFPAFDAPPWVMKIFIIVIIFGFPVALIFSWAFEITPEGIKLESEIEPSKSIARRTGRKIVAVTIALAVVAASLFVYQLVRSKSPVTPRQSEAATVPNKSIAVLPFDNLSRDPDNAYFADGIQGEILSRLSKIADLKVVSRTSTQRYKSAPNNLQEIAKQLGVAHVLEGTVQKAADQVRVNVQLINAVNDSQVWADKFDRKLADIFAVESEIATKIAETLEAKLTGAEQKAITARPTENNDAHQLYLRGRYFLSKRTEEGLNKSIECFNRAIDKDSRYALAYSGLADSNMYLLRLGFLRGLSRTETYERAKAAATKALELDDSLAEGHASLALVKMEYEWDWTGSEREFQRAIQLNPGFAEAHHQYSHYLTAVGRSSESALAESLRALELEPLSL